MEPSRFGRKLGIGVRVASRMVMQRATQTATPAGQHTAKAAAPPSAAPRPPDSRTTAKKNYTEPARRVGVGARRFGQAVLGPVKHLSGTLWLEITGLFFALFALFFAQNAWRTRAAALHGPEHAHFLLYAVITLVFVYFSVSSFVKAARRSRKARGRRSAQ